MDEKEKLSHLRDTALELRNIANGLSEDIKWLETRVEMENQMHDLVVTLLSNGERVMALTENDRNLKRQVDTILDGLGDEGVRMLERWKLLQSLLAVHSDVISRLTE
jgi:hypothetical protein